MEAETCFHCGLDLAPNRTLSFDDKSFCCKGCQTVYELFSYSGLLSYYEREAAPGATPPEANGRFDYLKNPDIARRLLQFEEGSTQMVTLHIPHIHCSSCVWILENLRKLHQGVLASQVHFHQKSVRITFNAAVLDLHTLVELLCRMGYEPYISLEDYGSKKPKANRRLTLQFAVAFFCFGNIMLLSFPEYLEYGEFWLEQYRGFFRFLILLLALPTFFYSASDYYLSAWKAIKTRTPNIEIPIALGLVVMFVRSVADMLLDHGPGFFDSLAGLVFFMLLGRIFQSKTYNFLSFERDYKSYFPIAVTQLSGGRETSVPVYEVKPGDRLLIRNQELIPADGILISQNASLDYSFVTGESVPAAKVSGDKIFAGGKQVGAAIEMEVVKPVSQSYLTQLWGSEVFQKPRHAQYENITNQISRYFTPALLLLAVAGFLFWLPRDVTTAFNVLTAVLIVACPCALALTAPFTLGNVLRILGRRKLYLKDAAVIERLSEIDTVVFDKTGTITSGNAVAMEYSGTPLSAVMQRKIRSVVRHSNHPLSRLLYAHLPQQHILEPTDLQEIPGKGLWAQVDGTSLRIGSASFTNAHSDKDQRQTRIYIAADGQLLGYFFLSGQYRYGLAKLAKRLSRRYKLVVLTGDNEGEKSRLRELFPGGTQLVFNRDPAQKLQFVANLKKDGAKVLMLGDGLNDAGALAESHVGIAVSENVNVFSPACDAILDASAFRQLEGFLQLSRKAMHIITLSFALSLLYNLVGLSFALSGKLLPLVAAILMPLSTITIVAFVTLAGNYYARKLLAKQSGKPDNYHSLPPEAPVILNPETQRKTQRETQAV